MNEELVIKNLKFVHWMIKRKFAVDPNEYEDIFQIGCIGLVKAAKTYKGDRGKFTSYAGKIIFNEIGTFYRTHNKKKKYNAFSLEDVAIDKGGKTIAFADMLEDPNAEICAASLLSVETIKDIISAMKTEQQRAICSDYVMTGLAQCEIAKKYKLSQAQVSRILQEFKRKIKEDWRS